MKGGSSFEKMRPGMPTYALKHKSRRCSRSRFWRPPNKVKQERKDPCTLSHKYLQNLFKRSKRKKAHFLRQHGRPQHPHPGAGAAPEPQRGAAAEEGPLRPVRHHRPPPQPTGHGGGGARRGHRFFRQFSTATTIAMHTRDTNVSMLWRMMLAVPFMGEIENWRTDDGRTDGRDKKKEERRRNWSKEGKKEQRATTSQARLRHTFIASQHARRSCTRADFGI